jgi:hypothetical protein
MYCFCIGADVAYNVTRTQFHSIIPSGTFSMSLKTLGMGYQLDIPFDIAQDQLRDTIQMLNPLLTV